MVIVLGNHTLHVAEFQSYTAMLDIDDHNRVAELTKSMNNETI